MAVNIDISKGLADRCRSGDRKAQFEIYNLYSKQMYNVCLRIVNHAADAEDILQESFLEAFKNMHSFRGESTFGAWLKKIVVNRSINGIKKKKHVLFDQVSEDEGGYEEQTMTDDDMHYEVKKVHSRLMELPEGYRVVLSLYLLEGYDHAEIGQILNITESTSKSQFNRAKTRLKELLKK